MISIETLLAIVCTEAIEYGGLAEVPDRVDGAQESYHSMKRGARGEYEGEGRELVEGSSPICYKLELIRTAEGKLEWEE